MARIGEKTISVDEFKYRTEFTVRPIFPAQTSEELKKTYLNNFIIEKIFSLEAEANNNIIQNKSFQALMKGIKEQSMREQLYYWEAFNKAELDTNEIKKVYKLAGREYDVEFYVIQHPKLIQKVQSAIKADSDSSKIIFNELYQSAGRTYKHKVKFRDSDNQAIHEALFSEPLQPDTIIGPIQIEEDSYIILKVVNWKYIPAIGGEDVQLRWNQVSQKMKQNQANHLWRAYSKNIMKGKKIEFEKATFNKLADLFRSIRLANYEEKINYNPFRQNEEGIQALAALNDMKSIMDMPFFSIDDKVWTVRDFRNELVSHPLVYRKQDFKEKDFYKQFKYAIADLIRDHYLTKEAYKKSLDKNYRVKRTCEMWKDSYNALNFRNEVLEAAIENGKIDSTNNHNKIQYLNGYIANLQKKHAAKIKIDTIEFEKINVTDVNMFVTQPNVPFPVVVPGFPQLTIEHRLDYTRNINN